MAKYRVRTSQFCALSKEQKFQGWLHSVAPVLHDDLVAFIKKSNSCYANRQKMEEVHAELTRRQLAVPLVKFLHTTFPNCVEEIKEAAVLPPPPTSKILAAAPDSEVFAYYKSGLLTFPQKTIMENDDPKILEKEVRSFLTNKVNGDYIIIGNRAYIEFFKLKFSRESHNFPVKDREIVRYRAKHGLGRFEHFVSPSNILRRLETNAGKQD